MHDLSVRTGVSVELLSSFRQVAKQSNVEMGELGNGISKFNRLISEAARGSDEAKASLKRFGIDPKDALQNQQAALAKVFQTINSLPPGIQRATAAQLAFGKSGDKLVDMIQNVGGSLDEFMRQAEAAGLVMSTDAANAADEFGDKLDALAFSAEEAERKVGQAAIPALTRAIDDLNEAFARHGDVVQIIAIGVSDVLSREIHDLETMVGILKVAAAYAKDGAAGAAIAYAESFGPKPLTTKVIDYGNSVAIDPKTGGPAGAGDFFHPNEKERKDALDKLKAFVKEWDFVITSSTGGGHNKGSAHYAGRALDVSVRNKTAQEIEAMMEAARSAGFGVRDERSRPPGQAVWSGPHIHLEQLTKAAQAANKELGGQEQILAGLARAIADADTKYQSFGKTTVEQQLATTYASLGIGKLTGAAQALGEQMMAELETTLRANEAREKHAEMVKTVSDAFREQVTAIVGEQSEMEKLNKLITDAKAVDAIDARTTAFLRMAGAMREVIENAPVNVPGIDAPVNPGQTGPSVTGGGSAPSVGLRQMLRWRADELAAMKFDWRSAVLEMSDDGTQVFSRFFQTVGENWKEALRNFALDFASTLRAMAAQALANQIWSTILKFASAAAGGSGSDFAGAHGGGSFDAGGKFGGFAVGTPSAPAGWAWVGEHGKELVNFRGGERVYSHDASMRMAGRSLTVNYHVHTPASSLSRETQTQLARRTARAIEASRTVDY